MTTITVNTLDDRNWSIAERGFLLLVLITETGNQTNSSWILVNTRQRQLIVDENRIKSILEIPNNQSFYQAYRYLITLIKALRRNEYDHICGLCYETKRMYYFQPVPSYVADWVSYITKAVWCMQMQEYDDSWNIIPDNSAQFAEIDAEHGLAQWLRYFINHESLFL